MTSAYDSIAGMYDRFWRDWYLPAALPALERLFFRQLPGGSKVLDVCCGSGHVTAEVVRRGYRVTGVDISPELIRLARINVPGAAFLVEDVRTLQQPARFDAALSTFDALNHLLSLDDLRKSFKAVAAALNPGALFVFDMNLEEAYSLDLRQWNVSVEDDSVFLVRGSFSTAEKLSVTELIWFSRTEADHWRRNIGFVEERCYTEAEIVEALTSAGFHTVEVLPAQEAGVRSDFAFGRIFVTARR